MKLDYTKVVEFAVLAAGVLYMTWANAAKVPVIEEKVLTHETRIAVLETKIDDIRSDVRAIRGAVIGRRARNGNGNPD